MKTIAQKIMDRPISEWPQSLPSEGLQDIEQELASLIQRATLLHCYVARRYNTGCGDQGHQASAKYANSALVKVRRSLGFSYPERLSQRIQL